MRKFMVGLSCFFLLFVVLLALPVAAAAQPGPNQNAKAHIPVCPGAASPGHVRCTARVIVDQNGQPEAQATPSGYGPAEFLHAYHLSGTVSTPTTIAIVDAFDHPNILSDLNYYSSTLGIPQMNDCPVASGTHLSPCFQKVDQRGGTAYPATDST